MFDLDRLLSDSMNLANVQPTTPIDGYAASGMPGAPQELGQRESARAVLSTMLETPADPGGASAGGGGINLQSSKQLQHAYYSLYHKYIRVCR